YIASTRTPSLSGARPTNAVYGDALNADASVNTAIELASKKTTVLGMRPAAGWQKTITTATAATQHLPNTKRSSASGTKMAGISISIMIADELTLGFFTAPSAWDRRSERRRWRGCR